MSPFEQFSKEIDDITQAYKQGRLMRFLLWLEYCRRRWRNEPMPFPMVDGEGEPVGESMDVYHLSLHDMMPHEVRDRLTAKVLLEGRRINAFSRETYKKMGKMVGRTTIQPGGFDLCPRTLGYLVAFFLRSRFVVWFVQNTINLERESNCDTPVRHCRTGVQV